MTLEATDQESAQFAVAPRVTLDDIKGNVAHEIYFTGNQVVSLNSEPDTVPVEVANQLGVLTICILVMKNGFNVVGKSAPASPENFNAGYGKKLAFEDAVRQIWQLEGYALRSKLSAQ